MSTPLSLASPTWLIERRTDEYGTLLHMIVGWSVVNEVSGVTQPIFFRCTPNWMDYDCWVGCGGRAKTYEIGEETTPYCVTQGDFTTVRDWLRAEAAINNAVAKGVA